VAEPIVDTASTDALEDALSGMFEAPKPPAAPVKAEPLPDTPEGDDAAADAVLAESDDAPEEVADGPEPEYEIEVEGVREIVRGKDQIKDMLQKAVHYSRNSEQNARVREALIVQAQAQQHAQQFQQAVAGDINEFQTLRGQLAQFDNLDWSAAFDTDPFGAMKLKEQRDQLRERAGAKAQEISNKQQQFQQGQAYAAQQALAAEAQALAAKLPEWRNSEKASAAKQEIIKEMASHYGYTAAEISSLYDHRHLLVLNDAVAYRKLMANKDGKLKQVREAPPVVRPGTASTQTNTKTEFTKARIELRRLGKTGNSHAQSALAEKMLSRVFK